ncbi:MAG: bifunctional hydroxymethylpyrimidine kinase/phosphomethylpyrimidine kinase [Thiomicrospira sp.]|uniref:bifunctional hydroxymethylpyrimidine kinase/phosphomethylpyrimidine kinase n=1 Tax=Thiomicrospira sp. TaxID=935 RepID=UPI0019EB035D|nr:bifunctional hydroxymethylpyrimidine kinase/phosphomethylpyrimidine kinase [Thiomicrospira sp.]MBE0493479.1 bifunctional hydroxymethylpyrimidine kinase/phosphomethylpyrimidine kinase [Thiomicrospira sp.]
MKQPIILSIAGSDTLAGAGLQADLKTIHALGGYAVTVTTAITAQNFAGVQAVYPLPSDQVAAQLDSLLSNVQIDAIKIGQLASAKIIQVLSQSLQGLHCPIVLDPVLVSSSGQALLSESAHSTLIKQLLPLASIITPNIPEVNTLLGTDFKGLANQMADIGRAFFALGVQAVLVKGGHSLDDQAVDYLLLPNQAPQAFSSPRIANLHVKGTGCALSSALAFYLSQGNSLEKAVEQAKAFLFQHLAQAHFAQLNQPVDSPRLINPSLSG